MAIDLRNKPIAITGASSGIGAATALACARAGMQVALAARRIDKCQELADTINREGGRAIAIACDVTDPAACEALTAKTVEAFGSIYSLYANAGYGFEATICDMSDAEMRAIFETNFFGTLNAIRPAVARMKAAGSGHVLICSSCLGKLTIPYYGAYSATKAAQVHIGRAMKLELAPAGIHVSTVHPIGTRTEFFDKVQASKAAVARGSGVARLVSQKSREYMQTPDLVARCTVACLRRPRSEVWTGILGPLTRLGMAICTAFPGIENGALRTMVAKRLKTHEAASQSVN